MKMGFQLVEGGCARNFVSAMQLVNTIYVEGPALYDREDFSISGSTTPGHRIKLLSGGDSRTGCRIPAEFVSGTVRGPFRDSPITRSDQSHRRSDAAVANRSQW